MGNQDKTPAQTPAPHYKAPNPEEIISRLNEDYRAEQSRAIRLSGELGHAKYQAKTWESEAMEGRRRISHLEGQVQGLTAAYNLLLARIPKPQE